MTEDSDGVTWLMIDGMTGRRRWVIVEILERDVAVAFAERRLGLQILDVDEPLDDEFGFRRHQKIDRLRPHHADRRAGDGAGDRQLVEPGAEFLRAGVGDRGRAAEHDGARHFPA